MGDWCGVKTTFLGAIEKYLGLVPKGVYREAEEQVLLLQDVLEQVSLLQDVLAYKEARLAELEMAHKARGRLVVAQIHRIYEERDDDE